MTVAAGAVFYKNEQSLTGRSKKPTSNNVEVNRWINILEDEAWSMHCSCVRSFYFAGKALL